MGNAAECIDCRRMRRSANEKWVISVVSGNVARVVFIKSRPPVRVHWVACGTCTVPDIFFFKLGGH